MVCTCRPLNFTLGSSVCGVPISPKKWVHFDKYKCVSYALQTFFFLSSLPVNLASTTPTYFGHKMTKASTRHKAQISKATNSSKFAVTGMSISTEKPRFFFRNSYFTRRRCSGAIGEWQVGSWSGFHYWAYHRCEWINEASVWVSEWTSERGKKWMNECMIVCISYATHQNLARSWDLALTSIFFSAHRVDLSPAPYYDYPGHDLDWACNMSMSRCRPIFGMNTEILHIWWAFMRRSLAVNTVWDVPSRPEPLYFARLRSQSQLDAQGSETLVERMSHCTGAPRTNIYAYSGRPRSACKQMAPFVKRPGLMMMVVPGGNESTR